MDKKRYILLHDAAPILQGQWLTAVARFEQCRNIDRVQWETLQAGPNDEDYESTWDDVLLALAIELEPGVLVSLETAGRKLYAYEIPKT